MASEWPAWVVLYNDRMRRASDPYEAFSLSDDNWPWRVSLEKEASIYFHRDAARAWQAFRDFLNGTPKEWARHALDQYLRGVKEGLNGGQA